jgi:hypothetical protein
VVCQMHASEAVSPDPSAPEVGAAIAGLSLGLARVDNGHAAISLVNARDTTIYANLGRNHDGMPHFETLVIRVVDAAGTERFGRLVSSRARSASGIPWQFIISLPPHSIYTCTIATELIPSLPGAAGAVDPRTATYHVSLRYSGTFMYHSGQTNEKIINEAQLESNSLTIAVPIESFSRLDQHPPELYHIATGEDLWRTW